MTKGYKIWLWLLLIGGAGSVLFGIIAVPSGIAGGIEIIILGILQIIAVSLMLFAQKKEGFYILCVSCAIGIIFGVTLDMLGGIAKIIITYLFINNKINFNKLDFSSQKDLNVDEREKINTSFEYNREINQEGEHSQDESNVDRFQSSKKDEMNKPHQRTTINYGETSAVDLYKELGINRAWDEREIREYLKQCQKDWIKRQGSTNDKEQLLRIDEILKLIENAYRYLTKKNRREKYDRELEAAYKAGKIYDEKEEELYTLVDQAKAYYSKGNIKMAMECAKEAVDGDVNDDSAYDLLIHCYFDMNLFGEALDIVDKAVTYFANNINFYWLGARIAIKGTKDFQDAQKRINNIINLFPDNSIGYSEQVNLHFRDGNEDLAFQEIDKYILEHPEDNSFKQNVAYNLDDYSNECYYYDQVEDASFIADKKSYNKCLELRTKAVQLFSDEHTQNQLERVKYYGKKEWNDWNMPAIKGLALYGTLLTVIGLGAIGVIFYAIMGLLIYFSYRPYWQINKTYVTGRMGTVELIINKIGSTSAIAAEWIFRFVIKLIGFIIKFALNLASGRFF